MADSAILRLYGRLIRIPVLGALVAWPVRFLKRLINDPSEVLNTRLDLYVAAGASLRSDMEAIYQRQDQLAKDVARLSAVVDQQTAVIDALLDRAAHGRVGSAAAAKRVLLKLEWEDGRTEEFAARIGQASGPVSANGALRSHVVGVSPRGGADHAA